MLSPEDVTVSKYGSPDECKDFNCEKAGYARFIQDPREAQRCQSENLCVTYLFKKSGKTIGYVCIAMGALQRKSLPKKRIQQKRFRNVPSPLLGQMARDVNYTKQGVGRIMVDWVLSTASRLSQEVGCRFVILDAELDKVEHYKNRFGFKPIPLEKGDKTALMYFDLGTSK